MVFHYRCLQTGPLNRHVPLTNTFEYMLGSWSRRKNTKNHVLNKWKLGPWKLIYNAYPEVNMTDKERSATSLNTTSGFKHHRLKLCVQFPKALPDTESMNSTYYAATSQAETADIC